MCDCITTVNDLLKEKNTSLLTTLFQEPDRVIVETQKINSKARGKPAMMLATYCPFCGEKYAEDTGPLSSLGKNNAKNV